MGRRRFAGMLAGLAVVAIGAAACGGGSGDSGSSSGSATKSPASSSTGSATTTTFMAATSTASFDQTTAALKKAVSGAGMMVMGSLDQAKALSMTGLNLKGAETIFVGNPTTGKMFFQTDPAAGAVLPVRMYVWVDSAGATEVGYFDPKPMLTAVDPELGAQADKLSMMAKQITGKATGGSVSAVGSGKASFVTAPTGMPFGQAVSGLKKKVASAGMMVLGNLSQAKALSMTGLKLPGAQSFFVGNPTIGKAFFQTDPAAGAEVPMGMYVWAGNDGNATIGHFDPQPLFTAINPKLSSGGATLASMAAQMTGSQ